MGEVLGTEARARTHPKPLRRATCSLNSSVRGAFGGELGDELRTMDLDSSLGPLLCHSGEGFASESLSVKPQAASDAAAALGSAHDKSEGFETETGIFYFCQRFWSWRRSFFFRRDVPNRERILADMFSFLLLLLLFGV